MEAKSAYELSNAELLERFAEAAARASVSGSGLVIDVAGETHRRNAMYLYGIVLARLEKLERPFAEGDRVTFSDDKGMKLMSVNAEDGRYYGEASTGSVYTIQRVWYDQRYGWTLSFREMQLFRFHAKRFKKVETAEAAA